MCIRDSGNTTDYETDELNRYAGIDGNGAVSYTHLKIHPVAPHRQMGGSRSHARVAPRFRARNGGHVGLSLIHICAPRPRPGTAAVSGRAAPF